MGALSGVFLVCVRRGNEAWREESCGRISDFSGIGWKVSDPGVVRGVRMGGVGVCERGKGT